MKARNTGQGERRRPPPQHPHSKTEYRQLRGIFRATGNPFFAPGERSRLWQNRPLDSIITTQKNGQTIVAELFFNHSGTETFRDKLLKVILADSLQDGQEPEKSKFCDNSRPDDTFPVRAVFIVKNAVFSKSRAGENTRKMPLLRNRGAERRVYANRASQQKKTTDIWFDEKDR